MKKIILLLFILICTKSFWAQAPSGFNYQAVARDINSIPITSGSLNIGFIIRDGASNGPVVYQESHSNITPNAIGLFNLTIGSGQVLNGDFNSLQWDNGAKYLEVLINGASSGSAQQLLSVPYALHAQNANDAWSKNGNAGTDVNNNFIGTTDNVALNFRIGNQPAGRLDPNGDVFLGNMAGTLNIGNSNTGIGDMALSSNTSGAGNTAIGSSTMRSNTIGDYNTAHGYGTLSSNLSGNGNTAMGFFALYGNAEGSYNTAIGSSTLYSNSSGSYNTALGESGLSSNTIGSDNTAIGSLALLLNTTGNFNTAL